MHKIWHSLDFSLDTLNEMTANTMSHFLEIEFTEIGNDYLRATMPVIDKTRQPYGLIHGGASTALAETLGSIASALVIDHNKQMCLGMEINANHLRGVKEGYVHAIAKPLHVGRSTHVWDIRICDDDDQMICVSRLTVAIIDKKGKEEEKTPEHEKHLLRLRLGRKRSE